MNIVLGIIIGLLVLMALITLHEFGHFLMARRSGVKVNEFGIGFPPRAIAWVKREVEQKDRSGQPILDADGQPVKKLKWTRLPKSEWGKSQPTLIFSLNWLPIGGFCAMDGESDAETKKGTFGATSYWNKTKILFGGVLMNWLAAFVILLVLAFTGMPEFLPNQFDSFQSDMHVMSGNGVIVTSVIEGSPAAAAGIKEGDYLSLPDQDSDTALLSPQDIIDYGTAHAGQTASYFVISGTDDTEGRWVEVALNPEGSEYNLGVGLGYSLAKARYTWAAPLVALETTARLTGETFKGLGELLWNLISGVGRLFSPDEAVREAGASALSTAGDSVSGPVGIIGVIFPAFASSGATNLAFLVALISVSLACMNVLPIPALDGGRWLLITIYKLRGKKLTKEIEERIVSRAFMVLIVLIIIITILDVVKLIF